MIVRLDATTAADAARIGGKGQGLVRLLKAGLPVPDAWCIPATVSVDEAARERCLNGALDSWWTANHHGGQWAVRSSAVSEDLADASFAGVYETVLGVDSVDGLRAAVDRCWAALEQDRAKVYRSETGIGAEGGIALILQRLLRPQVAGVLLTTNPLRPFAGEIAIDASWGLGETIVSGRVDPDHFVLDRESGAVRDQRIGEKQIEALWTGEAVLEREVEPERRKRPSLDAVQLGELYALARTVTERIGPRRDLEWAIADGHVVVLQDRPITNLPSEDPADVWSRRFGDEYLSECSLPLPADLMIDWIAETSFREMALLQGRKDLARMAPLRLYNGYAYASAGYITQMLRSVPPSLRASAQTGWFPPLVDERVAAAPWSPRLALGLLAAPRRDRDYSGIANNIEALARHTGTVEREIVPRLSQDYTALTDAQWRQQYEHVDMFGREHFRVLRWGMGFYNPLLHKTLEKLLDKWSDRDLYEDIVGGLDDTHTAAINRELAVLARTAAEMPAVADAIRSGAGYEDARAAPGSSFWDDYDAFLERHGHRSDSRDIARPRWCEQPGAVLELVRAQLRAHDAGRATGAAQAAGERRRAAEVDALARARSGPFGFIRGRVLERVIDLTQQYTRYRENQRYHLDYLLLHVRRLVLDQGRRLAQRGVIADIQDVFLLRGEEFWSVVEGGEPDAGVRDALEQRRAEHARNSARLPATYLFDDVETEVDDADASVSDDGDALRGAGVCRGVARGPARVVATLSDLGGVGPGDVLIAPNIDPGWTSVFPLLAGLVIETGGTLSHGAILAREYGIPAVSGVTGATKLIADGAPVEVDGSAGLVRVAA